MTITTVMFRGSLCETTYHDCEVRDLKLCELTHRPVGKVTTPFGFRLDELQVEYRDHQWYCDLD
jgi:hypothetical protein